MRRFVLLFCAAITLRAHDVITTKITWTREISRIVFDRCLRCHREGGSSFSLASYTEARPWAKAIKEEVLERRMPPFGAVKGFGELRDDQSLTQEQIELIAAWVEGGAPEGNPALLPQIARSASGSASETATGIEFVVTGTRRLDQAMTFRAIRPKFLAEDSSVRVIAQTPSGSVTPLVWLYPYRAKFARSYFFRKPLTFPSGTKIIMGPKGAGSVVLFASTEGRNDASSASVRVKAAP